GTAVEVLERDGAMTADLHEQPFRGVGRLGGFQGLVVKAEGEAMQATAPGDDAALVERQRADVRRFVFRDCSGLPGDGSGGAEVGPVFLEHDRARDEDARRWP